MAPDVTFSGPNTISSATLPPMHTSIFANICPERKVKHQLKIVGNDPILYNTRLVTNLPDKQEKPLDTRLHLLYLLLGYTSLVSLRQLHHHTQGTAARHDGCLVHGVSSRSPQRLMKTLTRSL